MQTVTTTPSVAQTLIDTFTPTDRKVDMRTNNGKKIKEWQNTDHYIVEVGVADLLVENYQSGELEPVQYNAVLVTLNTDGVDAVEPYLKEVKPTRSVRDSKYEYHELPNIVRYAQMFVFVEERADGKWGRDMNKIMSYFVANATLTSNGDVEYTYEVVTNGHKWDSNPFLGEGDYNYDKDDLSKLWDYKRLTEEVERKRTAVAEGKVRQAKIETVLEAGHRGYYFKRSQENVKKFLDSMQEPLELKKYATDSHSTETAVDKVMDYAEDLALVTVCEHFMKLIGKTSWDIDNHHFNHHFDDGYRYLATEEREKTMPTFIDDVYAYALTTEWFMRLSWSRIDESLKFRVLYKFMRLVQDTNY